MTADGSSGQRVTVVGATGDLGFGLAVRLAAAGVPVVIGSRDAARARQAAGRVEGLVPGADVAGEANEDAVTKSDLVVLSVPFASQASTLKTLREHLRPGQLLLDVTVPLAAAVGGRPTRALLVWEGSAAEQARALLPEGVGVVSGLHTISAAHLTDLELELGEDVLLCGDRKADKQRVARLLELIPGLRCVDCGRLEMSRITEQLTPLIIGLNIRYKTRAGVSLTSLPDGELV
jgi:NADPH-dependent F420 reductase